MASFGSLQQCEVTAALVYCVVTRHAMQLVELFGSTRDAWMADDLDGWLAANEIYDGVPAIVQHLQLQGAFYIVTTKQVSLSWSLRSAQRACASGVSALTV